MRKRFGSSKASEPFAGNRARACGATFDGVFVDLLKATSQGSHTLWRHKLRWIPGSCYEARVRVSTASALVLVAAATLPVAAVLFGKNEPPDTSPALLVETPFVASSTEPAAPPIDAPSDHRLTLPNGLPTALSCADGQRIVAQARAALAAEPPPVEPDKLGEATADWLDPHGLWSVAPDAPLGPLLRKLAPELLAELEAAPDSRPCSAADIAGLELTRWMGIVRSRFDAGHADASAKLLGPSPEVWTAISSSPFESGQVTRNAVDLATDLGRASGLLFAGYGGATKPFADAARERMAPQLGADGWARVVVAAAVRAYIPQLDAHGAWAPLDEELSIYDLDLEVDPPPRLWAEMTRTPVGVRIDKGALSPLLEGDVLLSIRGVALAGISVEQAEQLGVVTEANDLHVLALRGNANAPLPLIVKPPPPAPLGAPPIGELPMDVVRYGDGRVAVIAVPDVPDDLGVRLATLFSALHERNDVRGVLLDLRGNGGGSTDGAADALGLFLPGCPLFPMKRRDGGIETERASLVPKNLQWSGPVAALVDGDSASAAEMIAGALLSYRRGVVVGGQTYGKGCAQEYLDDDAHAGVLRLTTLLYALPDGSPVQKTGIVPEIRLGLPADDETEATVGRALSPWRGPDVRDLSRVKEVPWRSHNGRVGPCRDETTCRALRALGSARAAAR